MGLFGDIASSLLGGVNTIYNLWTNKRDFDYQKALQQTIFEREDTAVQRRMADLEAAGINPNLAAGSAAGAGSIVARSSTNDVNMGAALDTLMAKKQLEMQKLEREDLKYNIIKDKAIASQESFNKILTQAMVFNSLGLPVHSTINSDGFPSLYVKDTDKNKLYSTNISKMFEYQLNTAKNSADLLQKDIDYYNMDKAIKYVSQFMPDVNFGIKYGIK